MRFRKTRIGMIFIILCFTLAIEVYVYRKIVHYRNRIVALSCLPTAPYTNMVIFHSRKFYEVYQKAYRVIGVALAIELSILLIYWSYHV